MTITANYSGGDPRVGDGPQSGFVMMALLAIILPLFLLVGASSATMTKRDQALVRDVDSERALLAADAGIDEAVWRATNGSLVSGTAFSRAVSNDQNFTVEPVLLSTDGIDNDGDTLVDEADENIFRLTITGTFGTATRKIAAYLGPTSVLLPPLEAGLTVTAPVPEIRLEDTFLVSGHDTNMDGSSGPGPDLPGLSITPPGTAGDLNGELDVIEEQPRVVGSSPAPSLAVASGPIDLLALQLAIQNIASMVLTSDKYENVTWGDGPSHDFRVVYRDGDLRVEGDSRGAGILLVTGDLRTEDNFRWDGLIIVLGERIRMEDNSNVTGGIIFGGNDRIRMEDNSQILYSTETLSLISTLLGGSDFAAFNGWQEISIN